MLLLVLMTLTLMQAHSGSAKAKNQRCMLSATKQAISIKLSTVGFFFFNVTLTLTANVYMACPSCFFSFGLAEALYAALIHNASVSQVNFPNRTARYYFTAESIAAEDDYFCPISHQKKIHT